ncbi:MAG TPA: helix-turn-helix transcriptional regulator [Defluviitaleaceae bacterium]|nr:helix-turn-helix transcriptional regulator [Defluviitaleaceae bacterium]
MTNFADRLKLLREENELTQQDVADILNVSRATIAVYETKGKQPDYEKLLKLADCFNVSCELSAYIYVFVYVSRKGNYRLVLNGNISYETQCRTFIHEIKHITYDLPKLGYIIGIDMRYIHIEQKADFFFENFLKYY